MIALGITGLLKVVAPANLNKEFSFVPIWSWRFIGAFEIYSAYLCHIGQWANGLPMIYGFFGGVVYCVIRKGALAILPFPLLNIAANCINGLNNEVDTTKHIVPYFALGLVFSAVLCAFGSAEARPKKNKKN